MLNYIKAELWKVLHRRGVYVLLALLLLCTALFFMLYSYGGFSSLAKGISVTMVVGMLAAPLLVQLVDGGTADTLKNELSFGLRRGTVYWGKLCAALLLGLVLHLEEYLADALQFPSQNMDDHAVHFGLGVHQLHERGERLL